MEFKWRLHLPDFGHSEKPLAFRRKGASEEYREAHLHWMGEDAKADEPDFWIIGACSGRLPA